MSVRLRQARAASMDSHNDRSAEPSPNATADRSGFAEGIVQSVEQFAQATPILGAQRGHHSPVYALARLAQALCFPAARSGQVKLLHTLVVRRGRCLQTTTLDQQANQPGHLGLVSAGMFHEVTRAGARPAGKEGQRPPLHGCGFVRLAQQFLPLMLPKAVHERVKLLADVGDRRVRCRARSTDMVDFSN